MKRKLLLLVIAFIIHIGFFWLLVNLFQSPYPVLAFIAIAMYLIVIIILPYKKLLK